MTCLLSVASVLLLQALDLGCSSKYFTRVIKLETDRIDLKKQRKDSKLSHHDRHKIDSDIEYVDVKLDSLKKVAQDIEVVATFPSIWFCFVTPQCGNSSYGFISAY